MGENLTRKIIADHLVAGEVVLGREIVISIDQSLTHDATGTMVWRNLRQWAFPGCAPSAR